MRFKKPIKPMLARSGGIFSHPDWIFEPKIDGTRCIAHLGRAVNLQNRRQRSITFRYPELLSQLKQLKRSCVLDGEIAVLVKGRPDFSALSQRERQSDPLRIGYLSESLPASYIVFDLLFLGGKSLMSLPLLERKAILADVLPHEGNVVPMDFWDGAGEAYYSAALRLGLEGVVAKRKGSSYQPGVRSADWIKVKKGLTVDLVVGGYIPGKGHRRFTFGGLLLGAFRNGSLIYVGRVGSGFTQEELEDISSQLQPVEISPFENPPGTPGVTWVSPLLVMEVSALEVTSDGHLRAPTFIRQRHDRLPDECSLDQLKDACIRPSCKDSLPA